MIRAIALAVLIAAFGASTLVLAGDVQSGRKVAGMCQTCHGIDGVARIPIAPHLAGESANYLDAQLQAFRSGTREHEMMTVVASGLSDAQIDDVSAWYAQLIPVATPPAGHDADRAPTLCVSCHGADGMAVMEEAPHLAGESVIYIVTQLKAFRDGSRTHDIMSAVAADMTDAEMREAAEWYAGIEFSSTVPER